jgi:hypothetical protein
VQKGGRELVVDVRLALGLLAGIYVDGVEASILAGEDVREIAQVRTDLARTVLVLTRPAAG